MTGVGFMTTDNREPRDNLPPSSEKRIGKQNSKEKI